MIFQSEFNKVIWVAALIQLYILTNFLFVVFLDRTNKIFLEKPEVTPYILRKNSYLI